MSESRAESLNRDAHCLSIDLAALNNETRRQLGDGVIPPWTAAGPFAAVPVFVSRHDVRLMESVIAAIDVLVASRAYQNVVLSRASTIARHPVSQRGVCFGYDFHLGDQGPALIEINTNAGGLLLNLLLAKAQRFGDEMRDMAIAGRGIEQLEHEIVLMFENEWARARPNEALGTIAIVDDAPESQFLHPEFLLFRELFRRAGLQAFVVGPEQLRFDSNGLYFADHRIDLVYNRLVDFYLEEPAHRSIREAYLADATVVTPHPQAHALYADKRNLIELRDPELHRAAGLSSDQSNCLSTHIPETLLLDSGARDQWWSERKQWFLKPIHGYGSKAAYRGDKLTRSTFERILEQHYIAQRVVDPSVRHVEVDGREVPLKFDLRCFVYDTNVQLIASRLYHGQTTNFRTPGGGFAPVYTEAD
jgi:hypothetical protein